MDLVALETTRSSVDPTWRYKNCTEAMEMIRSGSSTQNKEKHSPMVHPHRLLVSGVTTCSMAAINSIKCMVILMSQITVSMVKMQLHLSAVTMSSLAMVEMTRSMAAQETTS